MRGLGGGVRRAGVCRGGGVVLLALWTVLLAASSGTHTTHAAHGRRDTRSKGGGGSLTIRSSEGGELGSITPTGPHFLPSGDGHVMATVGHTAYLLCRVGGSLGDLAKVSWIRKRDLHVLSSGLVVFASDQRFQVVHPEKSDNWTLQIKFAQVRDSGIYECQVNTEPKMHLSYNLSVVESRASMVGPEYVKAGSTINLTCTITPPQPLGLVYWYHNQDMLEYEGRVAITTVENPTGLRSQLTIEEATPSHSGNYTC